MKRIVIGGAFVVAALLILYVGFSVKRGVAPTSSPEAGVSAPVPITAEENTPDTIVYSLLSPDPNEEMTPLELDQSLTASDDQALDAFDQSFDASQF